MVNPPYVVINPLELLRSPGLQDQPRWAHSSHWLVCSSGQELDGEYFTDLRESSRARKRVEVPVNEDLRSDLPNISTGVAEFALFAGLFSARDFFASLKYMTVI
ncbi:hypothetical protein [Nitrosospira sp. Nsp11]|uniref:hypothetical protein n=1 Tax=Nitrosospira sp. Nsp11 TaxID=1855338 RepID=UPI000932E7A2|nr:hypothetical protein [Nitrosospira sp. Nsp11]